MRHMRAVLNEACMCWMTVVSRDELRVMVATLAFGMGTTSITP